MYLPVYLWTVDCKRRKVNQVANIDIDGWSNIEGKILNPFNHNLELVFLTKLQYNNNTILHKSKYLQYNTIQLASMKIVNNSIQFGHLIIVLQYNSPLIGQPWYRYGHIGRTLGKGDVLRIP